jgi:hypothetical protein
MQRNLSFMRIKLPSSTPCVKNNFQTSWTSNKFSNVDLLGLPGRTVFINFFIWCPLIPPGRARGLPPPLGPLPLSSFNLSLILSQLISSFIL